MAEKRMVSKKVVDTDFFMSQSATAQLLYFHLLIRADDDGFISNPKMVMKMIGSNEDDMLSLIRNKFVLDFDNGVVVIKHWRIHNYIQRDRYKETNWKEQLASLGIDENGSYTLNKVPVIDNTRHKYGQYKNVLLTDDQYEKLKEEFPNNYEEWIERVSEYCASQGKSYKDYLATIRNWSKKGNYKQHKIDIVPVYDDSKNPKISEDDLKRMQEELFNG